MYAICHIIPYHITAQHTTACHCIAYHPLPHQTKQTRPYHASITSISYHVTSHRRIISNTPYIMPYILPYLIIAQHTVACHSIPHHILPHQTKQTISHHANIISTSYHITYHTISKKSRITTYHILHHIISHHYIMSYDMTSYISYIISHHITSYLTHISTVADMLGFCLPPSRMYTYSKHTFVVNKCSHAFIKHQISVLY